MAKWKKGKLTKDLHSVGGTTIKVGTEVYYIRLKTRPDADNFRLTEYEYHYHDRVGKDYCRSIEFIIEGFPYHIEPYIR